MSYQGLGFLPFVIPELTAMGPIAAAEACAACFAMPGYCPNAFLDACKKIPGTQVVSPSDPVIPTVNPCWPGYTYGLNRDGKLGCWDENGKNQSEATTTCPAGWTFNTDPSKGPVGCVDGKGGLMTPQVPAKKPKSDDTMLYVGVGVGVLALAVGAAYVFSKKGKSK